ncbi:hypothetical protein D9M71_572670 [compost metagenome]
MYIDWGPEFASKHSAAFPDFLGAGLSANIGWLGLTHILAYGGAGYFPLRLVEHALAAKRLHRHPDAPDFQLPAYLVYPADPQPEALRLVLQIVREVTAEILHR